MEKIVSILLFSLVILHALPQITIAESDKKPQITLSFGVAPQKSASELAKTWTPFLNYLNKKTGCSIHFMTAIDVVTFEQRVTAGEYDIAYLNPHFYIRPESANYKVFAKEKDIMLTGTIIVHKDSAYQQLADLNGKTIAFPSPSAFAATLLPMAHFQKEGISVKLQFVGSHESVYRSVAKGLYPAGGTIKKAIEQADTPIREQLRILWTSPPYTPHPIAAHSRVSKEVLKKLKKVMLDMHKDPEGMALLKDIGFKGIVEAKDSEYDDIRKLNLKLPENKG